MFTFFSCGNMVKIKINESRRPCGKVSYITKIK